MPASPMYVLERDNTVVQVYLTHYAMGRRDLPGWRCTLPLICGRVAATVFALEEQGYIVVTEHGCPPGASTLDAVEEALCV